ncbi:MAG: FtsX-like permease family protein [Chloroflexi bacterium]|nr:FtsX-like permease family protein [Chloroflexota bacterium]
MASGFRRGAVLRHYLQYGVVVGLGGAIPGAIVGAFLARAVTGLYTSAISVPVTVNPLHWETLLVGIVFGLVVGTLAAAAPAYAASRLVPVDAMAALGPGATGGISMVERLLPPLRRLPGRWKLILRGIERNRRRTIYTAAGIVLALTLILVSWGMIDTMVVLLGRQFDDIQRQDGQVYLSSAADAETLEALRAVDGVASAEPVASLRMQVRSGSGSYATTLTGFRRDTEMHRFFDPSGDEVSLPADGILLGSAIGGLLDVGAGDEVTLALPDLGIELAGRIVGFVDEPLGSNAYMALQHLDQLAATAGLGRTVAMSAMVTYEPGVDRAVMRTRLNDLPGTAAFVDSRALYEMFRSYIGLFYAMVGVMLAFGAVMAFGLIFNTMSVNISERTVEIATLMAAGVDRGTLIRLITYENMILSALGVLPGLAAGYLVSKVFMDSYSSDLFAFDLHIKPLTLALSAAAIMAVALLSQWPGLRALRSFDVATIVRERAL